MMLGVPDSSNHTDFKNMACITILGEGPNAAAPIPNAAAPIPDPSAPKEPLLLDAWNTEGFLRWAAGEISD